VVVSVKRVCTFVALAALSALAVLVYSAKRRGDWDRQWRAYAPAPGREPPADTNPPEEPSITVAVGDSFWSIAEQLVQHQLGRRPDDGEVLEPWLALIDANRDRLVEPEDPDLLHPGQILRLPPL
jgi:nucleoid-associated protein YgaU